MWTDHKDSEMGLGARGHGVHVAFIVNLRACVSWDLKWAKVLVKVVVEM